MKITTTLLTAALLTSSAQAFEYEYLIRDGSLGAIAGAVIGNNVGDGDSETGAIIGGVTAVIAGEYGRRSKARNSSQSIAIVKNAPQVQTHEQEVQVKEQIWVADDHVTDVNGNVLYTVPGHYETRVVTKMITVYR